jgi:HEPN domain-containing protein
MNSSSYTQAEILLIKAAEDETALHVDGNPESILGFHAQQAVEKLIKALLSARSVPFELTHNLDRLRTALKAAGESLPSTPLPLDELNDFAVVYRYDLLFQLATPSKADLTDTVRLIREHIVARISALSGTP